jgi:hypothetical protein
MGCIGSAARLIIMGCTGSAARLPCLALINEKKVYLLNHSLPGDWLVFNSLCYSLLRDVL